MAEISGTNVAAKVVPFTTEDTYPTHEAIYGKGGWKSVNTLTERNNLPESRLEDGCSCYVRETNKVYIYNATTKEWSELETGSSEAISYSDLSNKPKLNNKEISGNHDFDYYGIPTKTSDLTNDGDGTAAFVTENYHDTTKQDKITVTNKLPASLISDLNVPVKTSDLINDGDGSKAFLTDITYQQIVGKLGFVPYNSSNPAGYLDTAETNALITTAISNKADKSTTLAGYGITNAYTKTEINDRIPSKPSQSGYYVLKVVNDSISWESVEDGDEKEF